MPYYGITQCYLPPGRGDIPTFTPTPKGTVTLLSQHKMYKIMNMCKNKATSADASIDGRRFVRSKPDLTGSPRQVSAAPSLSGSLVLVQNPEVISRHERKKTATNDRDEKVSSRMR